MGGCKDVMRKRTERPRSVCIFPDMDDPAAVACCSKTVRDRYRGPALRCCIEGGEHLRFSCRVEMRCHLIEQQKRRIEDDGAGNAQKLI